MAISKNGCSLQQRDLILDYLPSCSSSTNFTEEPKKLCHLFSFTIRFVIKQVKILLLYFSDMILKLLNSYKNTDEGEVVGEIVGIAVGYVEGRMLGTLLGTLVGLTLGRKVGVMLGVTDGICVGN